MKFRLTIAPDGDIMSHGYTAKKGEIHKMAMNFRRKLPVPKEIKELYPLSDKIKAIKTERDAMIADVFTGKSDKFLLIIGPCSADN